MEEFGFKLDTQFSPLCKGPLVSSVQPNGQTALPCGRRFLQIILGVVQTQVAQGLPAHLKEESPPMDFPRADGGHQDHGAQSRDEDKQGEGTQSSPGQGASSGQEKEVPERERTDSPRG